MAKYNFSNYEYEHEYGRNPRGTGHWAFIIPNAKIAGIAPETFIDGKDTIFWVPGVWTLTEAKKRAKVLLEANAVPSTTIYVAP